MTPVPGHPVRGSRSGRPIMALLDLLGRRWCLRILWELREAPGSFRSLQSRCDEVSPSVLNTRLAELRAARLLEVSEEGYRLTGEGRALGERLLQLSAWAENWAGGSEPPQAPVASPASGAAGRQGRGRRGRPANGS